MKIFICYIISKYLPAYAESSFQIKTYSNTFGTDETSIQFWNLSINSRRTFCFWLRYVIRISNKMQKASGILISYSDTERDASAVGKRKFTYIIWLKNLTKGRRLNFYSNTLPFRFENFFKKTENVYFFSSLLLVYHKLPFIKRQTA